MNDLTDIMSTALRLKRRSRKLRDEGDLAGAEAPLREAVSLLTPEVERLSSHSEQGQASTDAQQSLHEAGGELADLLGSLGGVLRRQGRFTEALAAYEAGSALEQDPGYGIAATYNQVQAIVLALLAHPETSEVHNAALHGEIDRVSERLLNSNLTERPDDPWAWSDLGLLRTLKGDEAGAEEAWVRLNALNPVPSVYRSGLSALEDIGARMDGYVPISHAIAHFKAQIKG